MRTFACVTKESEQATPTTSFILAADEHRARELAWRELVDARRRVSLEVRENGKLLWTGEAGGSAPMAA